MTCHVVVGAEIASSGELRLRIDAPIGVRGWSLVFGPMAGYLKSVHAVAEEDEEGVDGQKAMAMGIGWLSRASKARGGGFF